ncbi:LysR family transcriptional regulator [Burkholderia pseudomultivorans]|uniref:HTH-type transcriptional regulator PgrR n=2 Tax=Burkholderia pseudomultivorans TaxID=1207504 RepID=A0ABU2DWG8_9BURK|nr:LysR family transcriptional regulator [Burkholderia pseudomultivorans]MDR8727195.1 HTH-type transcriptional regulator PgrR [Burkholderia pseudomultivorans]MDR8734893.1 HTH-type transcriptional regulator PgrR [Burkholderia pseudomultivorans]MDR8740838.1 HTH-type transcriptional regulator PgrR [Burkholderia pseudomultivorans]MDR8751926.1 HTH-type transcriptional regulator PgrR [Burkholderia pseudomultivorans]MDR8777252.1 HTH-type transcriptional regulator PgrR [Burkholderia pseudomultivorans]
MHRTGMTELEVVLAVARRSSFRGAALELGMSTTAVSSAVAGLEARLKVRLFNRSTRSVSLTDAGRRYVTRIAPALDEIRSAGEEAGTGPDTPSGTLRVNAPQGAAFLLMEPLFYRYAQRYPDVRIDIVSESRMIDVVAEGFDAGIRLAESVPQDMIAVPLSRDVRMLVVATPDYLKAHGMPRHPRDLLAHRSIGMRMSHGGIYQWELERKGEKLRMDLPVRLALNEMAAIKQAVLLGLGIGFISEWFIDDELKRGALVPVLVPWCPSFGGLRLYYSGHRFVPARLRALIDLVHELRLNDALWPGNRAG